MNYYDVCTDDTRHADRWFLDEPLTKSGEVLDARKFRCGRPYVGPSPAMVPIQRQGRQVKFNLAAFDMPVVSTAIGEILCGLAPADIERFPVTIGTNIREFEILNVVSQVDCVDDVRSGARKWRPEDGRPDKIGQYIDFMNLVIDPLRTDGRHVLRIWGSLVELIVSDVVKDSLQGIQELGVVFRPVSGPKAPGWREHSK